MHFRQDNEIEGDFINFLLAEKFRDDNHVFSAELT